MRCLRVDTLDLFYQHRVDPDVPIEDVAGAVAGLAAAARSATSACPKPRRGTIRRAHAVHPVTAVQSEYSLWTRDPEPEVLPACAELGIGFVTFSPLGKGFLTGTVDRDNHFTEGDIRATIPRFSEQNRDTNQALVDHVRALASTRNATPGQVALAWLLARHPSIVSIPGTRSIKRIDENTHAASLPLSADDIADLNSLTDRVRVHGNRYNDHHMAFVGR